jgi:hypothetical protein
MANANLQDYDDLVAAVSKWIKRQDLVAMIPDWIQFAEEEFDYKIFVNARRARYIYSPTQAVFPAPSDMRKPIQAYMNGRLLDFFPIGYESQYAGGDVPIIANGYQIIGNQISVSVAQLTTFQLDYYRILPGLSEANESNWLLQDTPTTYLAGVLFHAFSYMRDAEKAAYWESLKNSTMQLYIDSDIGNRTPEGQLTIRKG